MGGSSSYPYNGQNVTPLGYGNRTGNGSETQQTSDNETDWTSALQGVGTMFSGAPSSVAVENNLGYLRNPDQGNFQIAGLNNYQQNMGNTASQAGSFYNQNANSALVNQGANQQLAAYNNLANMAQGNGPSLARANLQAGLNQTNQALQSQAMSSAGGAGLGNAQRNLLNAQAAAANNVQQQGQQASVAEQIGAMQSQVGAASALRSGAQNQQQINMANQQALINNQMSAYNGQFGANLAQTQANMAYDQANRDTGTAAANIGLQATNSGAQATQGYWKGLGQIGGAIFGLSDQNMKTDIEDEDGTQVMNFLKSFGKTEEPAQTVSTMGGAHPITTHGVIMDRGGLAPPKKDSGGGPLSALASMGGGGDTGDLEGMTDSGDMMSGIFSAFSDKRVKKDVKAADKDNQEFMDKLKSKSFRYKNPNTPHTAPGRIHGVMAQDMEKSKVGKGMVHETPMGKMFNMPKAVSATLSGLATLNKRMDHLEAGKGRKPMKKVG